MNQHDQMRKICIRALIECENVAKNRRLQVTASEYRAAIEWIEQSLSTEQPAVAQNWEPIETAPKDNKRALYLARFNESGELVELDFNGAWEYWQESWELAHINGYAWVSENGIEEPTHWAYQDLPLPKSTTNPAGAINEQLLDALKAVTTATDLTTYGMALHNASATIAAAEKAKGVVYYE